MSVENTNTFIVLLECGARIEIQTEKGCLPRETLFKINDVVGYVRKDAEVKYD